MKRHGPDPWGLRRAALCLIASAALVAPAGYGRADITDLFGPRESLQVQPEVDVFLRLDPDFRLIFQLQPTFVVSEGYADNAVGAYADWLVGSAVRNLFVPDEAKTRRLFLRLGAQYTDNVAQGSLGKKQVIVVQGDVTPHFFLPWELLIASRNRVELRWDLGADSPFSYRLRTRLQLEREFGIGAMALTPFVNAEVIWDHPPAMWSQFRAQSGLQLHYEWFGRGQAIEVNGELLCYLQPSRTYAPVLGLIWFLYF